MWFPDSLLRYDFSVISAHTSYGVCRMVISGPRLIFSLDHKLLEGSASLTFQSSPDVSGTRQRLLGCLQWFVGEGQSLQKRTALLGAVRRDPVGQHPLAVPAPVLGSVGEPLFFKILISYIFIFSYCNIPRVSGTPVYLPLLNSVFTCTL